MDNNDIATLKTEYKKTYAKMVALKKMYSSNKMPNGDTMTPAQKQKVIQQMKALDTEKQSIEARLKAMGVDIKQMLKKKQEEKSAQKAREQNTPTQTNDGEEYYSAGGDKAVQSSQQQVYATSSDGAAILKGLSSIAGDMYKLKNENSKAFQEINSSLSKLKNDSDSSANDLSKELEKFKAEVQKEFQAVNNKQMAIYKNLKETINEPLDKGMDKFQNQIQNIIANNQKESSKMINDKFENILKSIQEKISTDYNALAQRIGELVIAQMSNFEINYDKLTQMLVSKSGNTGLKIDVNTDELAKKINGKVVQVDQAVVSEKDLEFVAEIVTQKLLARGIGTQQEEKEKIFSVMDKFSSVYDNVFSLDDSSDFNSLDEDIANYMKNKDNSVLRDVIFAIDNIKDKAHKQILCGNNMRGEVLLYGLSSRMNNLIVSGSEAVNVILSAVLGNSIELLVKTEDLEYYKKLCLEYEKAPVHYDNEISHRLYQLKKKIFTDVSTQEADKAIINQIAQIKRSVGSIKNLDEARANQLMQLKVKLTSFRMSLLFNFDIAADVTDEAEKNLDINKILKTITQGTDIKDVDITKDN